MPPGPWFPRGAHSSVVSLSLDALGIALHSRTLRSRSPASLLIEPYLWVATRPDERGAWRASGRAGVVGFVDESLELYVWCLSTRSETRLDVRQEGSILVDVLNDELIPLLRCHGEVLAVTVADLVSVETLYPPDA